MNLDLNPDVRRFIEENVRAGTFQRPEDVVHAAVERMMRESDGEFGPGELEAMLAPAAAELARGEGIDGDEAYRARRERRAAGGQQSRTG